MSKALPTIALIGNPNCGKTALFNRLTGSNQSVGNWPGVTVEKVTGQLNTDTQSFHVIDLPGCYSFDMHAQHQAEDEAIPTQFLHTTKPDWIINIVHGLHLQRHLYLTLQILEANIPTLVVINMIDQTEKMGITFDLERFSQVLGCPVLALSAKYGDGMPALLTALQKPTPQPPTPRILPSWLTPSLETLTQALQPHSANPTWSALRCLENKSHHLWHHDATLVSILNQTHQTLQAQLDEDVDMLLAEQRYQTIETWLPDLRNTRTTHHHTTTAWLDRWLLNRWLGLPCFLMLMYGLFYACIQISQYAQRPLDTLSDLWLRQAPALWLAHAGTSPMWVHIYQQSIGTALTTTLSFIPVLWVLFFLLHILEHSGYMSRAAFVMDKIMSVLQLPGRAFVSLLIGFGCNVPAIMSTRTLRNSNDKIITAMMAPFMSCSARLAVYALFAQAFFQGNGHNIIFFLYLLGIGIAMFTGFLLRASHFPKQREPLLLELPRYQMPSLTIATKDSLRRVRGFLKRTCRFMLPACTVLALLANTPPLTANSHAQTLLEQGAQLITPYLSSIGIGAENWQATVALALGVVAKEVMVGVMHTLYHTHTHVALTSMTDLLHQSWRVCTTWLQPVHATTSITPVAPQTLHALRQHFGDTHHAIGFLIFTCLYIPCLSTIATLRKECARCWAWLSSLWSLIIATLSAITYHMIMQPHAITQSLWALWLGLIFSVVIGTWQLRQRASRRAS